MITRDQIAAAVSKNDALAESGKDIDWPGNYNVQLADAAYVAQQRALRVAMLLTGTDPRRLPRDRMVSVHLPEMIGGLPREEMLAALASLWIDGFGARAVIEG